MLLTFYLHKVERFDDTTLLEICSALTERLGMGRPFLSLHISIEKCFSHLTTNLVLLRALLLALYAVFQSECGWRAQTLTTMLGQESTQNGRMN